MPSTEDVNLVLRCRELSDIAARARELLGLRMGELGKTNLVYTFKNRIKPPGSILAKVKRKKAEEARNAPDGQVSYEPDHVTDAWGCRYVTLYQSQIPPTVRELLENFDGYNESAPEAIELIEFVIYTNRPEKDPLSITEDTLDVLKSCKISSNVRAAESIRKPENRKSAYSSVHLVFALPLTVEHAGKGPTREVARFEVQVRDIFEEGWGEIQHNLIYSDKDRLKLPNDAEASFDPLWQPHLNALKTFVDGCSQHASIIKRTYDFIQLKSMPSLETKSATSQPTDRDAIVATLRGVASSEMVGVIEVGYGLIIDAQEANSREEARTNYVTAAVKFREAIEGLGPLLGTPVTGRFDRTVEYFLKIEFANCLFFSKIPEEQQKSVEIYESLAAAYPQDPTVRLRLATAMASTRRGDEGALRHAIALIKEAIPLIAADPLTGPDHWLAISCYVHLGFLDWGLSVALEKRGDREGAVRSLREAVDHTTQGYRIWCRLDPAVRGVEIYLLSAHKALSNLLYYAAKFVRLEQNDAQINRKLIEDSIQDLSELDVPKYKEYYKTRDNIMHAYVAIGKRDSARQAARDNVNELKKLAESRVGRQLTATEIEGCLDEDEQRNYRTAASVIADIDGAT
ncbi:hypothetical protein [uncultured Methylobacterium sp.]|uniref:hypothetical protein n=1 Tax=uncultured Methylobacterium sp. TaxID=157278 RepID=UPI002593727B|nr:hypothetical protein [uncultured Methylobacterium sp.]